MTILYCSELGHKKPNTLFSASLSHYGTHYFVRTPCILSGRGVQFEGSDNGINCYRLTTKAYDQLETQVDIAMEEHLD